jgi:riboflavin synthase
MFTGIIEEIGKIQRISRVGTAVRFKIEVVSISKEIKNGDSISVNGACLTVVNFGRDYFEVEAVEETISRTNLGLLNVGSFVNLERARRFNDRIDGHIVQGHVDTTGIIRRIEPKLESNIFYISYPSNYRDLIVSKGSIAVDGVSLTVVDVFDESFSVSLIGYTMENTTSKFRKVGDVVNLEFDIIGKYVVNYLKREKNAESSVFNQFLDQPF